MRMTRRGGRAGAVAVALTTTAALSLAACGGSNNSDDGNGSNSGSNGGSSASNEFNAALDGVWNPSDAKGGTLTFAYPTDWPDSVDPGDTYYGFSWDFLRNYARKLVMFKTAPGDASNQLVPDLATDLGKASDGGKTWTYTLKKGIKFEDGTEITAADVKYAVERSFDKKVFPDGPAYFDAMLNYPSGYKGVYDSPDMNTDSAIETPDKYTIVFHLKQPFAGFDYLAQLPQTAPVPQAKDTGKKYEQHVISSGPYMFKTYSPGKEYVLVRNPNWDPATDPNRPALPDELDVKLGVEANDIDNQLISGDIDVAMAGTGVAPAALTKVLQDPTLKARADNPTLARLWYTSINPTVKPFDNIHCRRAVQYGMDRKAFQNAWGGPTTGDIATTLLPSLIPGHVQFDLYPAGPDQTGDLDAAKKELASCGQPNGFSTNMAFRSDRPQEQAEAEAFQQALDRIGIKVGLKPYTSENYFTSQCGLPSFVVKNDLGLCANGWGADWPDGFGFLSQIVDSRVIRATGGSSNTSVRIPAVDKMLDKAVVELDQAKREKMWGDIDRRVMKDASIYPGIFAKALVLRPLNGTNVFINQAEGGYYDYAAMGVKQ
jgi:peptide/nickel transport system substrate-binding protein